jgi:hypothetical protein
MRPEFYLKLRKNIGGHRYYRFAEILEIMVIILVEKIVATVKN